ncbi:hypothetical protein, partial [Vibrio anguillarum]|uniref:hypothetical protein n=1 Tax=Vibrio anguillarum TaxID=55601 RepID=UPI001BE3DA44
MRIIQIMCTGFTSKPILFPSMYAASCDNEQVNSPLFAAFRPEANPQDNLLSIIRTLALLISVNS